MKPSIEQNDNPGLKPKKMRKCRKCSVLLAFWELASDDLICQSCKIGK